MKRFTHNIKNPFTIITVLSAMILIAVFSSVLFNLFQAPSNIWFHIRDVLLLEYIKNTIYLITGTALLSGVIGFTSAYIVTYYDFTGRRFLNWFLVVPLAMPSYIAAYIYGDMFSYTGTIGRLLRNINPNFIVDVLSLPGAIIIFSVTLYPYVYLLVKSSLKRHTGLYVENAKLLHESKFRMIKNIIFPLVRPALVAGVLLVVLETLNDYGVVRYFGIRVFSYAIFDAWFRLGDVSSALRLSAFVMVFVFGIIALEKWMRGNRKYVMNGSSRNVQRKELSPSYQILTLFFLLTVLSIAIFIPVLEMIQNTWSTLDYVFRLETLYVVINTISISLITSFITVALSVFIVNYARQSHSKVKTALLKITNMGYAIPGAVIALSVLLFFLRIDRSLSHVYELVNPGGITLVLTSSIVMLSFAYVLRFLTIAFNSVEATYDSIGMQYTESSYTLGGSKMKTLFQIDLPLLKEGLISACIIVFIDVVKELPLTLILRPTNYDTIATTVYRYAGDEMIQEASGPALLLVMISTTMIYIITHLKRRKFYVRNNK